MPNFPTAADDLSNPGPSDPTTAPSHSAQHSTGNDILEALEAKVGIDASTVITSHDFRFRWAPAEYTVGLLGSAAYARNGKTGVIDFTGDNSVGATNNMSAFFTSIFTALTTGGKVQVLGGTYNLNNTLTIARDDINLEGVGHATLIQASNGASFPAGGTVIRVNQVEGCRIAFMRVNAGSFANIGIDVEYQAGAQSRINYVEHVQVQAALTRGILLSGSTNGAHCLYNRISLSSTGTDTAAFEVRANDFILTGNQSSGYKTAGIIFKGSGSLYGNHWFPLSTGNAVCYKHDAAAASAGTVQVVGDYPDSHIGNSVILVQSTTALRGISYRDINIVGGSMLDDTYPLIHLDGTSNTISQFSFSNNTAFAASATNRWSELVKITNRPNLSTIRIQNNDVLYCVRGSLTAITDIEPEGNRLHDGAAWFTWATGTTFQDHVADAEAHPGYAQQGDFAGHVNDASAAHQASATAFIPAGTIAATDVQAAIEEVASEAATPTALSDHLADTSDAHDASAVSFVPAGTIAATNVQAAIEEVNTEAGAATHIADTSDAHDASAISFVPVGTVAATDVQAAIAEVAAEAGAGGHPDLATHDALGLATDAALSSHEADTTSIHGITNTASLETTTGSQAKVDVHTADAADAHDASAVSFVPAGSIAATNVQAAIEEVATEAGVDHTQSHNHAASADGTALLPESVEVTGGPFALRGHISTATITSNQNDYNPTGLSEAVYVRASADTARTITGLAGGAAGRVLLLINIGPGAITLADESSSSTAANRFALPDTTSRVLGVDESVLLVYDEENNRWRPEGLAQGAPKDATYLTTTANTTLTNETAVGATPGGELGGSWTAPTVDTVHSGTSHAATQAAAEATADSALATHEAETLGIHGVTNTATLVLGDYVDAAGRTNGADGDFPFTPPNGAIEVVRNSTDGKTYLSIRAAGVWTSVEAT